MIQLYKDGSWQNFDEYGYLDMLDLGWSFTDEVTDEVVGVDTEPSENDIEPSENIIEELGVGEMTKRELEVHARKFNDCNGRPIELDRRMNRENMIKDFIEQKG